MLSNVFKCKSFLRFKRNIQNAVVNKTCSPSNTNISHIRSVNGNGRQSESKTYNYLLRIY